jgi:hypothetical protein
MALGHCGHGTGPLRAWHWATVGMALGHYIRLSTAYPVGPVGHCGHGTGPLWAWHWATAGMALGHYIRLSTAYPVGWASATDMTFSAKRPSGRGPNGTGPRADGKAAKQGGAGGEGTAEERDGRGRPELEARSKRRISGGGPRPLSKVAFDNRPNGILLASYLRLAPE